LIYKDVFSPLKHRETQYNSFSSDYDWEFASLICDGFKIFYQVTLLLLLFQEQSIVQLTLHHYTVLPTD
jgi:hypothetical protein